MRIDRVAEDVYVFISEVYLQATATVLLTSRGAVVIDTLPVPEESKRLQAFIAQRIGAGHVRYVVNTHHHGDHVYGTFLFGEAEVVAHDLCRQVLAQVGEAGLIRARRENPGLLEVTLRLPDITFDRELHLHVGDRHVQLLRLPGHSSDGIGAYIVDEKILVAGDAVMPVPHIARGNLPTLVQTLRTIAALEPAFVVQGHGDVLLRGEVDESVATGIAYLETIAQRVDEVIHKGESPRALQSFDIESCGLSRIPLDGLVSRLHLENLVALYKAGTSEVSRRDRRPPA